MNAHLALFVWMDYTITCTNALVSIVIYKLEVRALPLHCRLQTRQQAKSLQSGKEYERSSALEEVRH